MIPIVYRDRDDALGMARKIKTPGGVPWEIESQDGTTISPGEIVRLLRDPGAEISDRPNVHQHPRLKRRPNLRLRAAPTGRPSGPGPGNAALGRGAF